MWQLWGHLWLQFTACSFHRYEDPIEIEGKQKPFRELLSSYSKLFLLLLHNYTIPPFLSAHQTHPSIHSCCLSNLYLFFLCCYKHTYTHTLIITWIQLTQSVYCYLKWLCAYIYSLKCLLKG